MDINKVHLGDCLEVMKTLPDTYIKKYKCVDGCPIKDIGSVARFYYSAKPSQKEKNRGCEGLEDKNNHPTVKSISLMKYLITLINPPGGIVLDMFAGSGTTGVACKELNIPYILIEKEKEYIDIINARIYHDG